MALQDSDRSVSLTFFASAQGYGSGAHFNCIPNIQSFLYGGAIQLDLSLTHW
jgi:hypothetical protein